MSRTSLATVCALVLAAACHDPTAPPPLPGPQSIVLLVTPKMIADFANPDSSVAQFFTHYSSLTTRAAQTTVIFAVGNGDHILTYRGTNYWQDTVTWARFTDGVAVSDRILGYQQVSNIVQSFRNHAATLGIHLKVYDQIDSGDEFSENTFRFGRHSECMDPTWVSYNIRGALNADPLIYASEPAGITAGTSCGSFLADQVSVYLRDLGFDGILYSNQLGTTRTVASRKRSWIHAGGSARHPRLHAVLERRARVARPDVVRHLQRRTGRTFDVQFPE